MRCNTVTVVFKYGTFLTVCLVVSVRGGCLLHLLDPIPQPKTDVRGGYLVRGVDRCSSAGSARPLHGLRYAATHTNCH